MKSAAALGIIVSGRKETMDYLVALAAAGFAAIYALVVFRCLPKA